MRYQDKAKKIKVIEKISEEKHDIEKYVANLHDSSSKLMANMHKPAAEKQKMLANIFINAYIAAENLE